MRNNGFGPEKVIMHSIYCKIEEENEANIETGFTGLLLNNRMGRGKSVAFVVG